MGWYGAVLYTVGVIFCSGVGGGGGGVGAVSYPLVQNTPPPFNVGYIGERRAAGKDLGLVRRW